VKLDETEKNDQTVVDLHFKLPTSRIEEEEDWQNELVDDAPVRGTRPLSNIYERCKLLFVNLQILEQQRKARIGWLQ